MEGDWGGVFPFSTQYGSPIEPGVYLRGFAGLIWFTHLDVGWNEIPFGQTVAQLGGGTIRLSYAKVRTVFEAAHRQLTSIPGLDRLFADDVQWRYRYPFDGRDSRWVR